MNAFVGFRVNAAGYANPLVRRRLAQEILQDDKFADKVKALAEQAQIAPRPPIWGGRQAPSGSPRIGGAGGPSPRPRGGTKGGARPAAAGAGRRAPGTPRGAGHADGGGPGKAQSGRRARRPGAARPAADPAHCPAGTASRQDARGADGLAQGAPAGQSFHAAAPPSCHSPPAPNSEGAGRANLWQEAAEHLLHKDRRDTALALALDVLRADPEEQAALDIARRVHEYKGETREAAGMARRLLAARLARGETIAAAEALMHLLLLLPPPPDARTRDPAMAVACEGGAGATPSPPGARRWTDSEICPRTPTTGWPPKSAPPRPRWPKN